MGNYQKQSPAPRSKEPHEIWRGIGCLMILILPAISFSAASETIKYGLANKWPIPYQFLHTLRLHDIFYSTSGLRTIFNPISRIPNFFGILLIGLLYMLILSGTISIVYAVVYRIVGPGRYGPTDAPPSKHKATKKSR